jgi:hypothetical protein
MLMQVGRIRQNIVFGDHGLDIFVVGDQVPFDGGWKGATVISGTIIFSTTITITISIITTIRGPPLSFLGHGGVRPLGVIPQVSVHGARCNQYGWSDYLHAWCRLAAAPRRGAQRGAHRREARCRQGQGLKQAQDTFGDFMDTSGNPRPRRGGGGLGMGRTPPPRPDQAGGILPGGMYVEGGGGVYGLWSRIRACQRVTERDCSHGRSLAVVPTG